jgi:hypothetical protein
MMNRYGKKACFQRLDSPRVKIFIWPFENGALAFQRPNSLSAILACPL